MDDAAALRAAGLRVTASRLAILDAIRLGNHLDADRVARAVRERVGHVSTQAVYDSLHALTGAGLLRRIEPAGSPARYEARVGDNHHHLVCRRCGEVTDVDCVTGRAPCLEPSQTHGYDIDEAEVVFWGVCPECRSAGAAPDARTPGATPRGA
ncbi:Fur family transcriptional regulator [Actinorugispora endophytica]|uniref:Fur family ferric uptake transcriptional regulator n=1 Tax=Actinorugispora endophytica TaxID=1605990 RepID=A0A4V3D9E9_9ACTN|nr:Fur family transcriptional regulator [Actinorugispora endophytica]TDQ55330.1 Fur family ferric uptake transcriptional regulator [Actinorugispora endophytica]